MGRKKENRFTKNENNGQNGIIHQYDGVVKGVNKLKEGDMACKVRKEKKRKEKKEKKEKKRKGMKRKGKKRNEKERKGKGEKEKKRKRREEERRGEDVNVI